jgi:hypothetical protein
LASQQLQLANPSAALPLLREAVSTEVTYLQGQLPLLPEGRRLDLVAVFGDRWQIPFLQAQQSEAGAELALLTRLNRQGLLQNIQRSQALLARKGSWSRRSTASCHRSSRGWWSRHRLRRCCRLAWYWWSSSVNAATTAALTSSARPATSPCCCAPMAQSAPSGWGRRRRSRRR